MSGRFPQDYNELCGGSYHSDSSREGEYYITQRVIVSLGLESSQLSLQCPCFLPNNRILTWEESEKRILHSALQADLWVTKDTNKKGDMSSQWGSQAGELFGWKPCTETHREGESPEVDRCIPSILSPSAYTAFEENHSTRFQDTNLSESTWAPPLLFSLRSSSTEWQEERERNQRFTGHGKTPVNLVIDRTPPLLCSCNIN